MVWNITISINEDIYEKFCLAMNLTKDTENVAIETCMRWYIAKTFEKASHVYNPKTAARQNEDTNKDFYGKAIQRIPIWAVKPNQYNHKIHPRLFQGSCCHRPCYIDMMERLCSDENNLELYVPTFKNNYSQMKLDGPKSHGKVFEDDGDSVWIWSEVEEVLMKYKTNFCN